MGSKGKIVFNILFVVCFLVSCSFSDGNSEEYCDMIISKLQVQDSIRVDEVFEFEFDRAYVFNDCYISGKGFADRYDLNIDISEVEPGVSENIRRIVFVDANGKFVFEFKYTTENLLFEEGVVIYPETTIRRVGDESGNPISLAFEYAEHYDTVS